jgi:hypothetical protein
VKKALVVMFLTSIWWSAFALAGAEAPTPKDFHSLDTNIQTLKMDIIKLGHDLGLLEKELASDKGEELAVYLSLDISEGFTFRSIKLEINDQVVTRQDFTDKEVEALQLGGAKRIYAANLPPGHYNMKATLSGLIGKNRNHKNSVNLSVDKGQTKKNIELRIIYVRQKFLPEFAVRELE